MSILSGLEAELSKLWSEVSGDARTAVESALADARTEISVLEAKAADIEARVRTLASAAKSDVEQAIGAAGPGVKADVEQLIAKLVQDLEQALTA